MGVDSQGDATYYSTFLSQVRKSEDDQINIRGLNNYQVPRSVDPLKLEDRPDSDVEHFNSDSNDSGPSEASDSDSVVSFEQVINRSAYNPI